MPERASDIFPATITIHRRAENRANQRYKRAIARLSHDAVANPRSRQASVKRDRAPGEIRESDMLGRLRGDEGLGLGLLAAGAVEEGVERDSGDRGENNAVAENRLQLIRKDVEEVRRYDRDRPKPMAMATTSTLWR